MTKPTAASKRAFEKKIGHLAVELSGIHLLVQQHGIGVDGVNATFAHLHRTLAGAHQSAMHLAQTNDAGNFSLSNLAPAGFSPEGRMVGQAHTPQTPLPPVPSEDAGEDGGMLMA